jgi:hypothetical protein
MLALVIVNVERYRGLPSSGLMLAFWSTLSLGSFIAIHSRLVHFSAYPFVVKKN